MNSTEKYISECERVFSLERKIVKSNNQRKAGGWSFFGLIQYHTKSILNTLIFYPRELVSARAYLKKSWSLKRSAKGRKALVIGNGPSQGYLTLKTARWF